MRCRACHEKRREIDFLRAQLTKAQEERQTLLALVRPGAWTTERCQSFAADETGTVLLDRGQERELFLNDRGEPCIMIDQEVVPLAEYQAWMQKLHDG